MIPSSILDWSMLPGLASAWALNYLIHSTLLLGSVWLVSRYRRLSPGWQDTLWKAALIGGVVTATWQTLGPVDDPIGGRIHLTTATVEPAQSPVTPALIPVAPELQGVEISELPELPPATTKTYLIQLVNRVRTAAAHGWPQLLLGGWVLGAALCLARLGVIRSHLGRMIAGRRPVTEGTLPEQLQKLCRTAGWNHPVRLSSSSRLGGPIALVRSEICIPERMLTDLAPEQQENVLAHELAHVVRCDPAWRWISAILESLFFFQPLNRVARRHLEESAEFLCDDWAVRRTGQSLTLARCLVEVAQWVRPGSIPAHASAMADSRSPLVRRVERLLSGASPRETPQRWRALPALGLLCAVVVVSPVVTTGENEPPPVAGQPDGIWMELAMNSDPDVFEFFPDESRSEFFFEEPETPDTATDFVFVWDDDAPEGADAAAPAGTWVEETHEHPEPEPVMERSPRKRAPRVRDSIRREIQNRHEHRVHRIHRNQTRSERLQQHVIRMQQLKPILVQVKQNFPIFLRLKDLEHLEKELEKAPTAESVELLQHLIGNDLLQVDLGSFRVEVTAPVKNGNWIEPQNWEIRWQGDQWREGNEVLEKLNRNLEDERRALREVREALRELKVRSRNIHTIQRSPVI